MLQVLPSTSRDLSDHSIWSVCSLTLYALRVHVTIKVLRKIIFNCTVIIWNEKLKKFNNCYISKCIFLNSLLRLYFIRRWLRVCVCVKLELLRNFLIIFALNYIVLLFNTLNTILILWYSEIVRNHFSAFKIVDKSF